MEQKMKTEINNRE